MEKSHEFLVILVTLPTISIIIMLIVRYVLNKNWETAISVACGALILSAFVWRYIISPRL